MGLFGNKKQKENSQKEIKILWGTPTPLLAFIGTSPASLQLKGYCSVSIDDPLLFQEKAGDVENLASKLRPKILSALTETLGAYGRKVNSLQELQENPEGICKDVTEKLSQELYLSGLTIKELLIEEIKSL